MRIVVVGGGITGLVAAYRLRQHVALDDEVLLLEAGTRTGGHAATVCEDGYVVETGPNGFLERSGEPEPLALVRELGLEESLNRIQRGGEAAVTSCGAAGCGRCRRRHPSS